MGLKMAGVITPEFRVSYPNVFEARLNDQNNKMEYTLVALFKSGEKLDSLKNLVREEATKLWGADSKKWPKKMKSPFRDQAEREKELDDGTMVMPEGYSKGAIFINLKSRQQPGLIDAKRQPILDPAEFYAGCYARASVTAFAYDVKGNQGVAIWMTNLQKTRDGEPLSGRPKAEDEFSAIADGAAEEESDSSDLSDPFK
jgi:hypothetical protein